MLICVNIYDVMYSARLDWAEIAETRMCVLAFFFFNAFQAFFFFYCLFTVAATVYSLLRLPVAAKFDFFHFSTQILLFMNPHISLFSNFFIKNRSYGTIHTFKNYFVIVFFSFQFQFSVLNYI